MRNLNSSKNHAHAKVWNTFSRYKGMINFFQDFSVSIPKIYTQFPGNIGYFFPKNQQTVMMVGKANQSL